MVELSNFPFSFCHSFDIFVKVNSMGVISILYTLCFVVISSFAEVGVDIADTPKANTGLNTIYTCKACHIDICYIHVILINLYRVHIFNELDTALFEPVKYNGLLI